MATRVTRRSAEGVSKRASVAGSAGPHARHNRRLRHYFASILVHGMIIIMAGPMIDTFFKKKGEDVFVPGSIK